ncbi:MAG: bleomycin resistance family protein [Planctomycetota bacterium]
MKVDSVTPVLNVSDVVASLEWFEALGWARSFTWNDAGQIEGAKDRNDSGLAEFAGVCAGDAQIFLCLDGQGGRAGPRPMPPGAIEGTWMSWWIVSQAELDRIHALCLELGHDVPDAPINEPWGVREFHLKHPDGHVFRVSCGIG